MTQIYKDGEDIPAFARGTATALGNFDGVHRGHVHLLQQLQQKCPDYPLSVVTFEPHPRQLFFPEESSFRLTDIQEKIEVLTALGIDYIFQINFDRQFAALKAHDFLHKTLHQWLGVRHVICGESFAFGCHRTGSVDYLKDEGKLLGIGVTVEKALEDEKGIISSSRIRHELREGRPEYAAALLGRVWSLHGIVEKGDEKGRELGFPTANIALGFHLEPLRGVYAVKIELPNKKIYEAVANLGRRPTVSLLEKSRLEVHLFDFHQDIYGQDIKVWLYHFIRPEQKFPSIDALKAQITQDIIQAKECLARGNPSDFFLSKLERKF